MGSAEHLAHWDDVARERWDVGPMGVDYQDLGSAAGSVAVGVGRWIAHPGRRTTPAHVELADEEISYVLAGSGLSWQDGSTFEVRAGDCLVHLPCAQVHTLRAGPDGLDVLAFGERADPGGTLLPNAGLVRMGPANVDAPTAADPWEREAAAGELAFPPPSPRPGSIVHVGDAPVSPVGEGRRVRAEARDLGRAAGSRRTGLRHVTVAPGAWGCPAHCHGAEEELFIVLDGEGVLALGDEELPVRAGHVLARPPGTGVAHAFRAGDAGLVYLAYGTREPNDVVYYPRSNKVYLCGVGLIARVERLDYWDGER